MIIVAGVAALAAAIVSLAPTWLAAPAGLALALLLPGLALVRLLFRRRVLSGSEQFALVPALSLATIIVGGILMYAVGLRLTRGSWAGLTAGVSIVAAGLVYLRQMRAGRRGWATEDTAEFGTVLAARTEKVPLRRAAERLAPLALAVLLLSGAGYAALRSAQQHFTKPFTALSMTTSGAPVPVPTNAALSQRNVIIRVNCAERGDTTYTLRLSGPNGFGQTLPLRLAPGGIWSRGVDVPFPGKITADLFKGTDTGAAYRSVFLTDEQ
jgi:uncharacterized membrane protein